MTVQRRMARAVVFAAVVTGSSALAHDLAGGMVPGVRVLALVSAAALVIGWSLGARVRSVPVVAVAAVAGQLGAHVAYALSMQGATHAHALDMIMCGHAHAGAVAVGTPAAQGVWSAGWMTAAHVVAGVVVLLVARHGEQLATAAVAALRYVFAFLAPPAVAVTRRRRVLVSRPAGRRVELLRAAGLALRGPPLAA